MKTEEEIRAAFRVIRDDQKADPDYKQGALHVLAWVLDLFPEDSFQARFYDAAYTRGALACGIVTEMELTEKECEETERVFFEEV